MKWQKGSVTPVVLLVMLSVIIFAYYSYDMSRSYLAAKVQINTASELNDLTAITGVVEQNVERQISEANGLDIIGSYDNWTFDEHDSAEVISMSTDLPMQQHRKLTPNINGIKDNSYVVDAKTIRAKHYEDLNVIIAVSNDPATRDIVNVVKYELNDALKSLFDNTNSTLTVVPYGYRINFGNSKCGTTWPRSDGFSFVWWENYFAQLDILDNLEAERDSIRSSISSANAQIKRNLQRINQINLALVDADPETKDKLEAEKASLLNSNENLYSRIDDYQSNLEVVESQITEQKDLIADLEATTTYRLYKDLAYHYAKTKYNGSNYIYLDNYYDDFLQSNGYDYTDSDAILDSSRTDMTDINHLTIIKNKYFGNDRTCPKQQVKINSTDYRVFLSIVDAMDFSDNFTSPIQGFNYSLKKTFNLKNNRTIVINIMSLKDDYLSTQDQKDEEKFILADFCHTIQEKYVDDVSAKSIFIVDKNSNIDDIKSLSCNNLWNELTGIIEVDGEENLSDKIAYELLQESSSIYIGNEDDEW